VRGRGVDLVRRAITDVAVEDDQRRPVRGLGEHLQRVLDAPQVVGVADAQHVPAIGLEARGDVLGEGDAGLAFDGDVVVVVDPAEVVQGEMARERGRFRRHAFHHAAVAADRIDVVAEDLEVRPIVAVGKPRLGDGHANAGGNALAERSGGGFYTRHQMVLGVTRGLAAELTEVLDVVERHRRLPEPFVFGVHRAGAGEKEHRPQQHRGMTVGEHEPIAVRPDRVFRIEAHDPVPERVDERRQRHRRPGMSGIRLLDRIDRQRANAIDRQLVQLRVRHR
jgi:hypothetical protein